MTEEELIQQCINGDPQAEFMVYKCYAPMLLGICQRYARNADEAKDLLQEAMLKIFKNLAGIKHENLHPWMKRIAINTCVDHYRKNKNIEFVDADDFHNLGNEETEETDDHYTQAGKEELLTLIQSLPDTYRLVFNMYVMEDLRHHQIAEQLNLTETNCRKIYSRARGMLKTLVEAKINIIKN